MYAKRKVTVENAGSMHQTEHNVSVEASLREIRHEGEYDGVVD